MKSLNRLVLSLIFTGIVVISQTDNNYCKQQPLKVYNKSSTRMSPNKLAQKLIDISNSQNPEQFYSTFQQAMNYNNDDFLAFMNHKNEAGLTFLMETCLYNDPGWESYILDNMQKYNDDPDYLFKILDTRDNEGRTALWYAAQNRRLPVMKILMQKAAELFKDRKDLYYKFVATQDNTGWNPLSTLTYQSASDNLEFYIHEARKILGVRSPEFKQLMTLKDNTGKSVSDYAIDPGDLILLKQNGALNPEPNNSQENTLGHELIESVRTKNLEKTKKIVEQAIKDFKGDNASLYLFFATRNGGGWSAIMHAAADGSFKIAKYLLEQMQQIFKDNSNLFFTLLTNTDAQGRTPLQIALERRHYALAKLLINKAKEGGATLQNQFTNFLNAPDDLNGYTPLITAVKNSSEPSEYMEVIKLLLTIATKIYGEKTRGFDLFINARDKDNRTALDYAHDNDKIKLLKMYGAKSNDDNYIKGDLL